MLIVLDREDNVISAKGSVSSWEALCTSQVRSRTADELESVSVVFQQRYLTVETPKCKKADDECMESKAAIVVDETLLH